MNQPLDWVRTIKVKLGLLVVASVLAAVAVGALAQAGGVPLWLSFPITIAVALAVTQLLATGMTSPLREMTAASRRMATGDYSARVAATSSDEVGELARAFNTMARDLATVDRQRRELVANVSHELRTPLTALRAVLENLVDGVSQDPGSLEAAAAQAERLSQLVEDLLDLARVDAGKAPLDAVDVPVAELLTEAVAEARVSGREVEYVVRADPALVVRADRRRLHQLLANLLDNASRHSPTGGTVLLDAERRDGHWRLEVSDGGPGIAPADREHVFEPFGTLTGAAGVGGTGLGLAIARWVTDLHGGVIGFVDPAAGAVGARVRVDLPLTSPDRPRPPEEPVMPEIPTATQPVLPVVPPAGGAPTPLLDEMFGAFWPDRGVRGRPGTLLAAVGVGVLGGLLLPFQAVGIGTFLVLIAAGAVLVGASPRRREPFTMLCGVLCVLLASVTFVRDATWMMTLCLLAGIALAVCGLTGARSMLGIVLTGLSWPLAALRGMPWLGRCFGAAGQMPRGGPLLRTVLLSVTGLLVFGALFASADELVARWADDLLPDLSVGTFVLRAFVTVAVAGLVLAATYVAVNAPRTELDRSPVRAVSHRFEWLAPVLVVVAVFAVFLVAQATVVFGGHDYLQRTTGLTYAEYSHQGFGQLTVATGLTLLVIWAAARKAPRATTADRWWLGGSLGVLAGLTLVVVASALDRMHVYQQAYGFTRLRLVVDVFEGWLGVLVVVVLVGAVIGRWTWVPRFALVSGVVGLLGIAAINPDAWIAQRNLDRYAATGKVDWVYLAGLSDDAVPTLARLEGTDRSCALGWRSAPDDNWLEWNLGRARAAGDLSAGPAWGPCRGRG